MGNVINSKNEYYTLWKNLCLGNRIALFENLDDYLASGFDGPTSIRYRQPGSPYKAFYVPTAKVPDVVEKFISQGASRDQFTFNESTPDDDLLIQGEMVYLVGGLHLTYSTDNCSMKQAMEKPQHAVGLRAIGLLKYYLNPKSYDMVQELFELYPDSVIEFGAYSRHLGVMPGHNTVIWEVRNY